MHIAAMYNHSTCIEALLKHQSEAIDMQNFSGASPLQVGLLFYNLLCKYFIISCGILIAHLFRLIQKKFQISVVQLNQDCIEILLKYGADHVVINKNGETLLHLACRAILSR